MDNLEIFIDKLQSTLTCFRNKGLLVYDWHEPKKEECVESMYDSFHLDPTSSDPETLQRLLHYRKEFPSLWQDTKDLETRTYLLNWIISNWGSIHGVGYKTIQAYIDGLTSSQYQTTKYIKKNISSFSKCLAFIYPKECYVYDSRVALALNCFSLVHNYNHSIVFEKASSKSPKTADLTQLVENRIARKTKRINYIDYCQVVRRLAGVSDKSDKNYLDAHKIETELFMFGGWIREQMTPPLNAQAPDNELEKHLRSLF